MNRWLTSRLPVAFLLGFSLNAQALPHHDKEENEAKTVEKHVVIAIKADDGKVEFVGPGDVKKSLDIERMIGEKLPALLKYLPTDGEVKVEVRAVVVKPDGKQRTIVVERVGEDGEDVDVRVVEGDDGLAARLADEDRYAIWVAQAEAGGEFVIGVGCERVGEALRSHLRLGDEGLIISSVFEDTPAEKAGLRTYDVIVAANGHEIEELSDLVEVVQEAGEKETSLALKIIREGKSETVEVEPVKRGKAAGLQKMIEERLREVQRQQRKLRPEIAELLKKRVLLLEMDEDEHEHDGHHEHADNDQDGDEDEHEDEDADDAISELREQVEELQEAVEELQETLEELRDE